MMFLLCSIVVALVGGRSLSGNEYARGGVCVGGGCLHLWVEVCLGTFKSEGDGVSEGVLSI